MVAKIGAIISRMTLPKTGTTIVKELGENGKIYKTVLFGEGNAVAKAKGIKGFETYDGGLDTVWTASGEFGCNSNFAKRSNNYVRNFLKSVGWIK